MTFSPEIFQNVPFPIFLTDAKGIIVFKNRYCSNYMSGVRRGVNIFRQLKDGYSSFPEKDAFCVELTGGQTFPKALVMKKTVGGETVYMFFSPAWIQAETDDEIIGIASSCGTDDPIVLYADLYNKAEKFSSLRLYGDITSLAVKASIEILPQDDICDTEMLLKNLFSRLSGAFKAIGVRISTSVSDDLFPNRYARVKKNEYIMFICRLTYIALRCSDDKSISLNAHYDSESDSIEVSIKTKTSFDIDKSNIVQYVPECAIESELISRIHALDKAIRAEKIGDFAVFSYSVPCEELSSMRLHSEFSITDDTDFVILSNEMTVIKMFKSKNPAVSESES